MPNSIISYDKDLPEIPGRRPWERPTSFLVKDSSAETGWRVDESGRRPSKLLLIQKLRIAVDHWRDDGYPGASEVTQRLFTYWFDEDYEIANFPVPFRYHFCQREAIETLVYLGLSTPRKRLRQQPHLPRVATHPAGVARHLEPESHPAR